MLCACKKSLIFYAGVFVLLFARVSSLYAQGMPVTGNALIDIGGVSAGELGVPVVIPVNIDLTGVTAVDGSNVTVPAVLGNYRIAISYDNTLLKARNVADVVSGGITSEFSLPAHANIITNGASDTLVTMQTQLSTVSPLGLINVAQIEFDVLSALPATTGLTITVLDIRTALLFTGETTPGVIGGASISSIATNGSMNIRAATDSDADKLPDVIELSYGLNPYSADSDDDGISDYDEVCYDGNCLAYNPYNVISNPAGTDLNASLTDTDGDGFSDAIELRVGSDPVAAVSFPGSEPTRYTILNPGLVGAEAWVVSLSDDNVITAGSTVLTLNRYQRGQIPAGVLTQGMVVSGIGSFDIGSSENATDVPLSSRMAGTSFVMPHVRDNHWYYLVSPEGDASAQVNVNGVITALTLLQGQVVEFYAAYDTTGTALITSDLPILVEHRGDAGLAFNDAAPVPPAALELWGVIPFVPSYVGALEDNTTVNIYADDGTSITNVVLNAGQRYSIFGVGVAGSQGTGSALRIVADKPVGAIQNDDGDGIDQTSFMPTSQLGVHFGLPTDTQYAAVVCPTPNTTVTLYDGIKPPQSIVCSANGISPGKAYFGAMTNGANIAAGAYLEADQPVYVIYEDTLSDDERNLIGSAW